ncbi:MAG: lactonase family protein [Planctomycetales bacterium]|nr:lactonase family protein [Planctomycetales bacterium]
MRHCNAQRVIVLVFGLTFPCLMPAAEVAAPLSLRVYIGTYTGGPSQGIYHSTMSLITGELTPPRLAVETKNPSFLAIHPNRKFLYAVNEVDDFQGRPDGAVNAFAMNVLTGSLTPLNQQSSMGAAPCHLVVDAAGNNVLVANYTGGSIAVLPLDLDGRLRSAATSIQHSATNAVKPGKVMPHAHSINLDTANRFAYVADLSLDKVLIYRFDGTTSSLVANDPPAGLLAQGSGPRHLAFHPTGRFAFVNNETSSTVTLFRCNSETGRLTEVQTLSTLPHDVPGNSTAETVVHPTGKFVYVSNRGHDSLAIFQFNDMTGKLTAVGHCLTGGKAPRNFNIDPTGQYLIAANQATNDVRSFQINVDTGALTATGSTIHVGSPSCIRFVSMQP